MAALADDSSEEVASDSSEVHTNDPSDQSSDEDSIMPKLLMKVEKATKAASSAAAASIYKATLRHVSDLASNSVDMSEG